MHLFLFVNSIKTKLSSEINKTDILRSVIKKHMKGEIYVEK